MFPALASPYPPPQPLPFQPFHAHHAPHEAFSDCSHVVNEGGQCYDLTLNDTPHKQSPRPHPHPGGCRQCYDFTVNDTPHEQPPPALPPPPHRWLRLDVERHAARAALLSRRIVNDNKCGFDQFSFVVDLRAFDELERVVVDHHRRAILLEQSEQRMTYQTL